MRQSWCQTALLDKWLPLSSTILVGSNKICSTIYFEGTGLREPEARQAGRKRFTSRFPPSASKRNKMRKWNAPDSLQPSQWKTDEEAATGQWPLLCWGDRAFPPGSPALPPDRAGGIPRGWLTEPLKSGNAPRVYLDTAAALGHTLNSHFLPGVRQLCQRHLSSLTSSSSRCLLPPLRNTETFVIFLPGKGRRLPEMRFLPLWMRQGYPRRRRSKRSTGSLRCSVNLTSAPLPRLGLLLASLPLPTWPRPSVPAYQTEVAASFPRAGLTQPINLYLR